MLPKFPKIKHLDEMTSEEKWKLFSGDVEITEKVDGSQVCLWKGHGKKIRVKSKNNELHREFRTMPDFDPLLEFIDLLESCREGWRVPKCCEVYCEYLKEPKHNVLKYKRVPTHNSVLLGVWLTDYKRWMTPNETKFMAYLLGLENVPILRYGKEDEKSVKKYLSRKSFLGGKIEGIVIKNYHTGVWGKLVRPEFRETRSKVWKRFKAKRKINEKDLVEFSDAVLTNARYRKVRDTLKHEGRLRKVALLQRVYDDVQAEFPQYCSCFNDIAIRRQITGYAKKMGYIRG